MTHVPHELAADFPEHAERIAELRRTDTHFARLADDYHTQNKAVYLAETDLEPTSDDHLVAMRKERMRLKDAIFGYLTRV